MRSTRLGRCAVVLCVLSLWLNVPAQDFGPTSNAPTPKYDKSAIRIEQRLGQALPMDVPFLDQFGRPVRFGDLIGARPAIVVPIFYRCPGVCSLELQSLLASLPKTGREVGKDLDVIVVGIDPQEGPANAKDKFETTIGPAMNTNDNAGWHLLTGSVENIRQETDALGFHYTYDAGTDVVNHPSGIMFITPKGTVSSYILGASYTPDALTRNLDLAAKNDIGPKSQDVFFGCIHIDPLTGKKSVVVTRFLSLAALVTLVLLGGLITYLFRTAPSAERLAQREKVGRNDA